MERKKKREREIYMEKGVAKKGGVRRRVKRERDIYMEKGVAKKGGVRRRVKRERDGITIDTARLLITLCNLTG
jgi:hypothetical protein